VNSIQTNTRIIILYLKVLVRLRIEN